MINIFMIHEKLLKIKGIQIYSPKNNKGPTIAFNIDDRIRII